MKKYFFYFYCRTDDYLIQKNMDKLSLFEFTAWCSTIPFHARQTRNI